MIPFIASISEKYPLGYNNRRDTHYIRPGVDWFCEAMPQAECRLAEDLADVCDAMLVVGTSGMVLPESHGL